MNAEGAPSTPSSCSAFLAAYNAATMQHPVIKQWRIHMHNGRPADMVMLEVSLSRDDETIRLDAILTPADARGRGLASRALDWFVSLAREHQVRVVGHVEPFGAAGNRLGHRALRAWYKRHGFHVHRNGMIVLAKESHVDTTTTGEAAARRPAQPQPSGARCG